MSMENWDNPEYENRGAKWGAPRWATFHFINEGPDRTVPWSWLGNPWAAVIFVSRVERM